MKSAVRSMVEKAFRGFGAEAVVVHRGVEKASRGFLQPITKETLEEPFHVGVLGAAEERCWRWLGAADCAIEQGDGLVFNGERFCAVRAEAVYIGGEVSHYEAVLRREESE